MDDAKYDRQITLLCPVCGSDQFSYDDEDDAAPVTCVDCGRETTRSQLIDDNSEVIESNVAEIGDEVVADVAKELNKSLADAFRGNKSIRFK